MMRRQLARLLEIENEWLILYIAKQGALSFKERGDAFGVSAFLLYCSS